MSKLDRAVDGALRRMVAGNGPHDLRRRVMARVDEPARRSPVRWPALATAAGIAVAVAGVALLRTARGREVGAPAVAPPALTRPVAPASDARVAAASPHVPTSPSAPAPLRPRRRAARQMEAPPLGESVVDMDVDVDVDVEPIELSPLDVVPMSGDPIAVTALRIERMQIEPLAEPQP
jgi:hypothetical protein